VRVYSAGGRVAGEGGAAVDAAAEPTSGEVSGAVLIGARFDAYCFADSADGTELIAGSRNGLSGVWGVRSGVCIATLGSQDSWEKNACLSVSRDGRIIAIGRSHKGAFVRSSRAGNGGVAVLLDCARRTVNCVAMSSDGTLVVTGDDSGGVCACAAASGTLLRRVSDRTGSAIASVGLTVTPRVRSDQDSAEDGDNGETGVTWRWFTRPKQKRTPAQPRYVASRDADRRCCL
jgi:WD40 repeat protein